MTWIFKNMGKRKAHNEGYLGVHDGSMFPNRELPGAMTRVLCSLTCLVAVPCSHPVPKLKGQSASTGKETTHSWGAVRRGVREGVDVWLGSWVRRCVLNVGRGNREW